MREPQSIRRRAGFTQHQRIDWREPGAEFANNIVLPSGDGVLNWIAEATGKIGEWRSALRDVYLRWAITINAMHLAQQHWRGRPEDVALQTMSMRSGPGGAAMQAPIAVWPSREAAENYERATPILSAYGASDMYGALEEVIFELYLCFLNDVPMTLMRGQEFSQLRRLYRDREAGDQARMAWEDAWASRLESWRRKKLYDGLHNVLRAFFEHAALVRPSTYRLTDIDDWCRTVEAIGELRNCVTHGASRVSDRLATLSHQLVGDAFRFNEGDPLDVRLEHLMFIECFCDQLLTAINLSLVEKVMGPVGRRR